MLREYKYMAIGRYVEGVNVLGYVLRDMNNGTTGLVRRSEVEKLALDKMIGNIAAQVYNGKVIMKGQDCKLSELPNYDSEGTILDTRLKGCGNSEEIMLSARILDGKSTIGYTVSLVCNGVTVDNKQVTREKAIKLARNGYIANARVQMSNGKPILRGMNCDLAQLPILRKSDKNKRRRSVIA